MAPTETRYAQIEKKKNVLVLTRACERSWEDIVGTSISAETDHKLLVPLLSTRTVDQLSPRIERFRMRWMRFHFKELNHVPRKMSIADPFQDSKPEAKQWSQQLTLKKWMHTSEAWPHHCLPQTRDYSRSWKHRRRTPVCRQIKVYCCEGWPQKYSLNDAIKPYWSRRGQHSAQGIQDCNSSFHTPWDTG